MTTSPVDPTPRLLTGPPQDGTEIETLVGALERNRRTFAWKCGGLDAAGMRQTLGASTMTLGGLVKHLALVEDEYLTRQLTDAPRLSAPFDGVDFEADPDWEWRTASDDTPEELVALWQACVERSRRNLDAAYAAGPDARSRAAWRDGHPPRVRRLVVDLVEEYARHTGHADLLRESVDGLVGEGAPLDEPTGALR